MEHRIRLRKGLDGYYVAQCLAVPGAISQGRTKEQALRDVKEALELILNDSTDDSPPSSAVRGHTRRLGEEALSDWKEVRVRLKL